ncbi:hypothetical protein ADUPG1_010910 [Aduncisulcus paluster]|uniref:Uncharacterized protein n=1 Tax=Aduncisulcus paluster TaxID=2918883 RepID=A0ABQ5JVG7_9EUKA|nr:hypothetical protein ADUPG1_010910 [Aduncisulcus paluster]
MFDSASIGNFETDLEESTGFVVRTQELSIVLSFEFAFKMLVFPYSYEKGNIMVSAIDADAYFEGFFFEQDHCQNFSFSEIKITFGSFVLSSQDTSELFNDLLETVSPLLQTAIEQEVDDKMADVINEIIQPMMMSSKCSQVDPTHGIVRDQRVTSDPIIYDGYYEEPISEVFYDGTADGFYQIDPDTYTELPTIVNEKDFQIIVKPDFLTSAFYSYNRLESSFFYYEYEATDLDSFPYSFTLGTLRQFFSSLPEFLSDYPDSTPLQVVMKLGDVPDVSMMPAAIGVNTNGFNLTFQVQDIDASTPSWIDVVSAVPFDLILAAIPTPNVNSDGEVHGCPFVFNMYSASLDKDSEIYSSVINVTSFEYFICVLLDSSLTVSLTSWIVDCDLDVPASHSGMYVMKNPEIWYGDDFFGIFVDLVYGGITQFGSKNRTESGMVSYFDPFGASNDVSCLG